MFKYSQIVSVYVISFIAPLVEIFFGKMSKSSEAEEY